MSVEERKGFPDCCCRPNSRRLRVAQVRGSEWWRFGAILGAVRSIPNAARILFDACVRLDVTGSVVTGPNPSALGSRMARTVNEPMIEYEYTVDRADALQWVSDHWLSFAAENKAVGMEPELIIGRSLWDFISGAETRHLYEHLFSRARESNASVAVPFRCDSPAARRFMRLEIQPGRDRQLRIVVRVDREEVRDPVALLESSRARTDRLLTMCSWCRRILVGEQWEEVEEAISDLGLFAGDALPTISHGVCPDCYDGVMAL